jgi:C4-dicarboxylate-specific signal transduction histidine kinase
VLLSGTDAFIPSVIVSVIAVLCLDYFFIPPIYSLELNNPLDLVALVAFLGTASLITYQMSQRKQAEEALQKLADELELKVQERTAELAKANDELRGEIAERQRAEEALQKAQGELAHVTRVMTLGELTSSIAHEVNQPLAAVVTNGQAALRWLALEIPRLDEVRAAVERVVRDGNRASEVIQRIRALAKKNPTLMVSVDINDVIREAILLVQREVSSRGALLRTELASALPAVLGDRIQLQQVVVNLVINGVDAMASITDRPREIVIQSQPHETREVLVAVRDSGIGLDAESADRLFNAFFTTKPSGMGMGLSISRSIITAHGGKLWASPNADHGAAFQFTVPIDGGAAS